jgi:Tripeptidyl peptidase II
MNSMPFACRYVYDGVLEAQFIMVHDANKQLLGVADIYPGAHLSVCLKPKTCRSVFR